MTSAIMQPTYLPWVGYFDLIDSVNKFVFLDSVQLAKRSWQTRNRINTAQGELFLTIPIEKQKSRDETFINEAIIANTNNWKHKHLSSIEYAYKKCPYFDEIFHFISDIYKTPYTRLVDFNTCLIKNIAVRMGIRTQFYRASELINTKHLKKDELLASICKQLNAYNYLSPIGSAAYIELKQPGGEFTQNGIQLYYQNFQHPQYCQKETPFVPYMCILDLLFHEGFENSLAIIQSGRKHPYYFEQYNVGLGRIAS